MLQPIRIGLPTWSELEDGVTWATAVTQGTGTRGNGKIRLMAERLSDGSWEWTTWRAIRPGEFQSGSLSTQEAACAAAERAAMEMAVISHLPPGRFEQNARRSRASGGENADEPAVSDGSGESK